MNISGVDGFSRRITFVITENGAKYMKIIFSSATLQRRVIKMDSTFLSCNPRNLTKVGFTIDKDRRCYLKDKEELLITRLN